VGTDREAAAVALVLRAGAPGAEAGSEVVHSFEWGARPAHEGCEGTARASALEPEMA
jgi:hypothetical protein